MLFSYTRKLCEPKVTVRVARESKTIAVQFAHDILWRISQKIVRWLVSLNITPFQNLDKTIMSFGFNNKSHTKIYWCPLNRYNDLWNPFGLKESRSKHYATSPSFNFVNFQEGLRNYSAPYYMISCLAVVLQQGMRCISNFRSS